jgi:hypothetical protein
MVFLRKTPLYDRRQEAGVRTQNLNVRKKNNDRVQHKWPGTAKACGAALDMNST